MNSTRSFVPAFALAAALLASASAHAAPVTRHATKAAPHGEVLAFIEDDYAKALAEARARQVPLFIESWAPW